MKKEESKVMIIHQDRKSLITPSLHLCLLWVHFANNEVETSYHPNAYMKCVKMYKETKM